MDIAVLLLATFVITVVVWKKLSRPKTVWNTYRSIEGLPEIPDGYTLWAGQGAIPSLPKMVLLRDGTELIDDDGFAGWLWKEFGSGLFYTRDEVVAYRELSAEERIETGHAA